MRCGSKSRSKCLSQFPVTFAPRSKQKDLIFKHPVDPFSKCHIARIIIRGLFQLILDFLRQQLMLVCVCHFSLFTHVVSFLSLQSKKNAPNCLTFHYLSFPLQSLKRSVSCSSLQCLTLSAVSLNVCLFILLPSLVSLWIVGYRAQLSADAGQRRPSQKEKYVRPRDYLSPLCHHAPDTPTPSPSTLLSLWIG